MGCRGCRTSRATEARECPTLADRTTLTPAQIANLLDFVLRSTYFQYNGTICEQREGAAMGSPVSAVIANLYMETFEEQAIESAASKPKIWKRYVDDAFTILDRDRVDSFLQYLNSQQPTIRFTMETENDNKIAFFDTSVSREPDGGLTTSVYRKPTHTDQYLAYDSHHPQSVKRGIVKCLYQCVRPGETSHDQTVSHLRGKETFVICACLQRISLLLCAEDQQSKNSPKERARGIIQIHRRFTLRSGSVGASSPLPRTTRHLHRLQIRNDTLVTFGAT